MLRPIRSFTPSIRVSLIVGLVLLAFAVVPHLLLAAPAAPSLHVDNNLDFSGGACLTLTLGDCSLRSAIQIANVNPNVTILFDGDYTITLDKALEMVECAHCGLHLPAADAVVAGSRVFCSQAHQALGARPSGPR